MDSMQSTLPQDGKVKPPYNECALEPHQGLLFIRGNDRHLESLVSDAERTLEHLFAELVSSSYQPFLFGKARERLDRRAWQLKEDSAVLFAKIRVLLKEGAAR